MNKHIKQLAGTIIVTTASIHVANVIVANLATSKQILDKSPGHYYHWNDNDVYYHKEGHGTPLLLLHNLYPDSSAYEWKNIIHTLSHNHTVYAIDLIGCGRSSKPDIIYTNFYYAQFLNSFIREVIKKPAYVVASINTAPIAIVAANLSPSLYHKLILINPVALVQMTMAPTPRDRIRQFVFKLPVYGTGLYQFTMQHPVERIKFISRFAYFRSKQKQWPDAYCESAHLERGKGRYLLSSIENHYLNINMKTSLQNLPVPTHIIISSDYKDSYSIATAYSKFNPSITISVVRQSKYLPQIDEPRRTCDAIEAYIQLPVQ